MTRAQKRRLGMVLFIAAGMAATLLLTLNAFQQNLLFFFTPTQVAAGEAPSTAQFRLGGVVAESSVERQGAVVRFVITDFVNEVVVEYRGILPDLFREGQGVVVAGTWRAGVLTASEVLAKHDENYMPPEAARALRK